MTAARSSLNTGWIVWQMSPNVNHILMIKTTTDQPPSYLSILRNGSKIWAIQAISGRFDKYIVEVNSYLLGTVSGPRRSIPRWRGLSTSAFDENSLHWPTPMWSRSRS